jgi:iron complex transport system ATP-binding protein
MTEPSPLLSLEGVSVAFGERVAVRSATFSVRPGEFVALTGPNGAGKTTLLRAVLGLLPASQGTIRVRGTPIEQLDYRARALRMAWLPQDERPQDNVRLLDYVLFGRFAHVPPFYSENSEDFGRARSALLSVGLWDRRDSGIWEVSGGERQRVLLARALAQDAPILLLDEPTAHLDIASQLELIHRLLALCRDGSRCVVAALHDLNLAARYADRVLVLSRGRLVQDGRAGDVLSPAILREVWEVDAELRRDPRSGLPYLIPVLPRGVESAGSAELRPGPVHVVGGGGAASEFLRLLVAEDFRVTTGVLALFDTDSETAQELGLPTALEIPFAPLGELARSENRRLLDASAAVVIAPFAVGAANLANLEDLLPFANSRPMYVVRPDALPGRDFTGGRAVEIVRELLRRGAVGVANAPELLAGLRACVRSPISSAPRTTSPG